MVCFGFSDWVSAHAESGYLFHGTNRLKKSTNNWLRYHPGDMASLRHILDVSASSTARHYRSAMKICSSTEEKVNAT